MENHFESVFVNRYQAVASELDLDHRMQTLCAISALVSLGNHDFLESYLKYALEQTLTQEEIQEVILQCYLFAGFPAAIEGFIVLKAVQGDQYQALGEKNPDNIDHWREQGFELCRQVYAENYDRMWNNIQALNPDLASWMIFEGYGKTLSRSGLKPVTREFCAIASLAVLGWDRQLYSHCKGAMNLGATKENVVSVLTLSELFRKGALTEHQYIFDHL